MKKLIVVLILHSINLAAQDLINPYRDYNTLPINDYYAYPPQANYSAPNPNGFLFTPSDRNSINSGQYNGEYMIMLNEHPWFIHPSFQALG